MTKQKTSVCGASTSGLRNTQSPVKLGLLGLMLCVIVPLQAMAASTGDPSIIDARFPPASAELTIGPDGQRMAALMYLANGPGPHPTVIMLHGLPGHEKSLDIAQAARREGFNTVFLHYRGAWGSEGSYRISQLAEDAVASARYLRGAAVAQRYRVDPGQISVLGHSLGGYAALASAALDPAMACAGAMAPVNVALWATASSQRDPSFKMWTDYADTLFMLRDFNARSMQQDLASKPVQSFDTTLLGPALSGKAVLLVGGSEDQVTPPAQHLQPAANAYARQQDLRLSQHLIPGDHGFSYSRLRLTELVIDWLNQECRSQ